MILSNQNKERIRLEESYRFEIKYNIEKGKNHKNPYWEFVNSSFGLFLLSAIFLSGFGQIYSNWEKQKLKKSELEILAIEHLVEIDYRIEQISFHRALIADSLNKFRNSSMKVWRTIGGDIGYTPTNPKFTQTPLFGIISWFKITKIINNHDFNDSQIAILYKNLIHLQGTTNDGIYDASDLDCLDKTLIVLKKFRHSINSKF